ncbi:hypothetical protein EX30DRAFT_61724 [Ascodesmis nigricans]|uniref:Uncharacterized protein n=1 Tax=Ascodesmis nigricans TaxID=341454 RepID=A0A4S2MUC9_9PEZI|nr:hypothetical protein EX30DRAFT_61724 [Ascodesmis nigricans]
MMFSTAWLHTQLWCHRPDTWKPQHRSFTLLLASLPHPFEISSFNMSRIKSIILTSICAYPRYVLVITSSTIPDRLQKAILLMRSTIRMPTVLVKTQQGTVESSPIPTRKAILA